MGKYLRGDFVFSSARDAEKKAALLISVHAAACVQLLGSTASIKTNRDKQSEVDALLGPGVRWNGIGGNPSYLAWIDTETTGDPSASNGGVPPPLQLLIY